MKVVVRAVDSATKLKSWDEVFSWCDQGLLLDPADSKLKASRLKAVKEKVRKDVLNAKAVRGIFEGSDIFVLTKMIE